MYNGRKTSAVIVAAGKSSRFGRDKLLLPICGKTVIEMSVDAFIFCGFFDEIIVVAGDNKVELEELLKDRSILITAGGENRFDSVLNGVRLATGEVVAVHDGARPFVSTEVIVDTIDAMDRVRVAAPSLPVVETVKLLDGEFVESTPPRERLVSVQTPQTFYREDYLLAAKNYIGDTPTDDCMVMESAGHRVLVTKGSADNIKITTKADIQKQKRGMMRVGQGYDVHRLVLDRKLVLGGVEIEHSHGLLGHSDADVLCHAISDALLGAAALGDIGKHFPDTDPKYKGANSIRLLEEVSLLLGKQGYRIINIDSTVIAQQPKIAPYILAMRKNISDATGISLNSVSVKATTEEGLGFTGNKEGISCVAVAFIEE